MHPLKIIILLAVLFTVCFNRNLQSESSTPSGAKDDGSYTDELYRALLKPQTKSDSLSLLIEIDGDQPN